VIRFINQQRGNSIKYRKKIKQWVDEIVLFYDKKCLDINLVFVSEDDILKTNIEYLNHHYLTDIITFDYCENEFVSGELIICPDVVRANAKYFNTTYEKELHRVIIHGILHLIGYNDATEEEKKEMRAREDAALLLFDELG
jgi:probable rRNA maturation factor